MTEHEQALAIRADIAATEIKFHDDAPELLARFKATGREIEFDESGRPMAIYDHQLIPLRDALTRWALDDRTIADRRTLPRKDEGRGRPGMASKADFATLQDKTAFIRERGVDAYEALPLKAPVTREVKFKEDFFALPVAQKAKLLSDDPSYLNRLPNRPRGSTLKIDPSKIDRHKSKYQLAVEAAQRAEMGLEGII
jgi:hypothetical protein